ncbi:hypothetical protein [Nitrobacter sp. JJSN]|uniref:hypothetical protein n=1 Tax=Nitrobacter sp. JJSN TaxID=3453033 RepID=UPI003F75F9F2
MIGKKGTELAEVCRQGVDTGLAALGYARVTTILGVVQGISELLPISSAAHTRRAAFARGARRPLPQRT